jgi:hypothetical protein
MPCLLVLAAWFVPRVVMIFIWLLTDWFSRAYQTWYWPLLGFFLLPYTTLAYMAAQLQGGLQGWWVALLIFAVIMDIGGQSGSTRKRRKKR